MCTKTIYSQRVKRNGAAESLQGGWQIDFSWFLRITLHFAVQCCPCLHMVHSCRELGLGWDPAISHFCFLSASKSPVLTSLTWIK